MSWPERRACWSRRACLAAALSPVLAGCGFRLRAGDPIALEKVALAGFGPRSPMAAALKRALATQVRVVDDPARAEATVVALAEQREKLMLARTAGNLLREVQLRSRLRMRIDRPAPATGLAAFELLQTRDMSYSESIALAKAYEEQDLYAEMEAEIARQVVQRLAILKP